MKDIHKIFIHHRSSHHSNYSGYSQLLNHINGRIIKGKPLIPYRLGKIISQRLNNGAGIYDTNSLYKELELFFHLLRARHKKIIIHYLNAERDIRYNVRFHKKDNNTKFIGTFHKPPDILKKQITNVQYLKSLQGVIAVGPNQVNFLKEWLNISNVQFIPHGVDTNFFVPGPNNPDSSDHKIRLLFVGQHMRDFDALNYSIPRIKSIYPNCEIQAVFRKEYAKYLDKPSQVNIYHGISNEKLRSLYQEATLLFLPLIDSTACNSILEALAAGLPILTSDVGGNDGYIDDSCAIQVAPHRYRDLLDAAIMLIRKEQLRHTMKLQARRKALNFSWEKISHSIQTFYHSLYQ
jgi:glycosyltransferase involved in cell wall biosynthesis